MFLKRIIFLACAMAALGVMNSRAADLTVPGTHATLTAALAAATTDSTITIMNSASYAESLTIDKRITLKAAAGQSPTITGNPASFFVLNFMPWTGGSKLGDLAGGRINITGDSYDNTTTQSRVVWLQHTSGTLTVENVRVFGHYNYHTATSGAVAPNKNRDQNNMFTFGATAATEPIGNIVMRNVTVEGGAYGACWRTRASASTVLMEDCSFDVQVFAIFIRGTGEYTFNRCTFSNNQPAWGTVYMEANASTNRFNNCWTHAKGASPCVSLATRRVHQSYANRCAFTKAGATGAVFTFANSSYGDQWLIDHCDVYSSTTTPQFNFAATQISAGNTTDGMRRLEITNSNLVNEQGPIVGGGLSNEIALIMRRNNIVSPTDPAVMANPATAGFQTYQVEFGIFATFPSYVSRTTGNLVYSDIQLVRAGTGFTPLGSYYDFSTMTPGVMPPSAVPNFTIYQ